MNESQTQAITIRVETHYQERDSNPEDQHFVFAYRITIENNGDHTVKLLSRKWEITDSDSTKREIEGEGVVGRQPVLEPGQTHQYVSGCNFQTEMGKMGGYYVMENHADGRQFQVDIPEFLLIAPYKLN